MNAGHPKWLINIVHKNVLETHADQIPVVQMLSDCLLKQNICYCWKTYSSCDRLVMCMHSLLDFLSFKHFLDHVDHQGLSIGIHMMHFYIKNMYN